MNLIWLKKSDKSKLLVNKDTNDAYAALTIVKKRSGAICWRVEAEWPYERRFPDLERTYGYEEAFAIEAAEKIAARIVQSETERVKR